MVCVNRVTDELSHALKSLIYASSQALTIYVKLSYLQWCHIYVLASQYISQRVAPYLRPVAILFSANEQYFFLTTNQSTVLSAMAYQPNEQGILCCSCQTSM